MANTPVQTFTSKLDEVQTKATNAFNSLSEQGKQFTNGITGEYQKAKNSIDQSNTVGAIKNSFSKATAVTEEFAEKNSTIAKVVFVVFVFVMFGLLFRLGVYILSLFFVPTRNPIVVDGMRSTLTSKEYQVNPNVKEPKPILRSINEDQGMEFTWSSWVWINSTDYANTTPRLLFTKGQTSASSEFNSSYEREFMMNSPGLYMYDGSTSKTNALSVVVSFFDENVSDAGNEDLMPYEVVTIRNIPMQKWVNVIIRVQGRILDVYINGTLTKREEYSRVIKQNYGNVHVGSAKYGADAYVSSLRYFDHAVGANTIQDIMYSGPKLKMEGDEMTHTNPPYLAMRWYLDDN